MFLARERLGPVELAFTDRHGGVSASPYDSLNLAVAGGDDRAAVAENHRIVLDAFAPGARLVDLHQVHGADVVLAEDWLDAGNDGRPSADGLVTGRADVVLMARAADCVPVLLADADAGVVAAVHAGRPGVAVGVVPAAVRRMREQGARTITAWVGPHVCGACYEVPADLQDEVAAVEPATRATTRWGTPALDLGAGVRVQLERDGVEVHELARCTRESEDLYSYRRDGENAGRLAGLVRIHRDQG